MKWFKRFLGMIILVKFKLIYGKKILFKHNVVFSPRIRIRCSDNGKLIFKDRVCLRDNVLMNVSEQGEIWLDKNVFINDDCKFNCKKRIYVGQNTMIGQNVLFYDHDHDYKKGTLEKISHFVVKDIVIEENVWIGAGCIILKGVHIGKNSVIGAGTIVTRDVKPDTIIYSRNIIEERLL